MYLTQAQWYDKLRAWVPSWFFEEEETNVALVQALAKDLSLADQSADDHFNATFITRAIANFIDIQGYERNILRLPGEADELYDPRVRNIINQSDVVDLKMLVDALLIQGQSTFWEPSTGEVISCNRGSFLSRKEIFQDMKYNTFSIVVDKQSHDPYSFFNRGFFCNRLDLISSSDSVEQVFTSIIEAVDRNHADGTSYRVVELT